MIGDFFSGIDLAAFVCLSKEFPLTAEDPMTLRVGIMTYHSLGLDEKSG